MNRDDELLNRQSLADLKDAERRLHSHIKKRKRLLRPSTPRRLVGLLFSVPMVVTGLFIAADIFIIGTRYQTGYILALGGSLFVAGLMWLYSDWIEY